MNVGRYQVLKEIGSGSMGVVYQAHDPNLDLVVALKVLRKDRLANEPVVRRFLAEAKALGRLDHPNIVRVYNVDREGDIVFIAMEFIEGDSLSGVMKKRRFTADEIVEFGANAAEALDSAHQKGIIHRDVKPSNILLRSDGRFKITDYGIAHIEDPAAQEETQVGEILGTPAYMSPEQVLSRPVDGRSDLFSLGIILYELATGVRPFTGDGINAIFKAITEDEPVDIRKKYPELPQALADAIMRCLGKSPEQRYADGRDLAAALRRSLPGPETKSVEALPAGPVRSSRALSYGLALLVFLVAARLAAYTLVPRKSAPPVAVRKEPPVKPSILDMASKPPGAQVFADGVHRGTAPVRIELASGKHEVRLVLPRYYEWEAQLDLKEATTTQLLVPLTPIGDK